MIVIYTNKIIPERFAAHTYGPFVLIRPKYKEDRGLYQHEKTHVKQWLRNPLMGLWYNFSPKSRLKYEAEAYAVQLEYYPDNRLDKFAQLLVDKYELQITLDEARSAILKFLT